MGQISYMFQSNALFDSMTVLDFVGAVSPPGRKPYGLEATAMNSLGPKSMIVVGNHSHQTLTSTSIMTLNFMKFHTRKRAKRS